MTKSVSGALRTSPSTNCSGLAFTHSREVAAVDQQNAQRSVLRGLESGGAVEGFGRYVTFTDAGKLLSHLCSIESLAVNGLDVVAVVPALVRALMLRAGHTYDLLISRHEAAGTGKHPTIESKVEEELLGVTA